MCISKAARKGALHFAAWLTAGSGGSQNTFTSLLGRVTASVYNPYKDYCKRCATDKRH